MQIAIAEAKAQFAELIRRAEAGEAIEVTRYGKLVAKIVPAQTKPTRPLIGALVGQVSSCPDFFEPLSEEELALWEGR